MAWNQLFSLGLIILNASCFIRRYRSSSLGTDTTNEITICTRNFTSFLTFSFRPQVHGQILRLLTNRHLTSKIYLGLATSRVTEFVSLFLTHLNFPAFIGNTFSPTRFSSLDWIDQLDEQGIIAGGMEDGAITLWSASKIIAQDAT